MSVRGGSGAEKKIMTVLTSTRVGIDGEKPTPIAAAG